MKAFYWHRFRFYETVLLILCQIIVSGQCFVFFLLSSIEAFCSLLSRDFFNSISLSKIDGKGGTEADVRTRIGKARTAFANLSNLWKASKISISTKIRLFNSNVKSVLLYGCETWKTTQGVINKLQVFVNRCLRKIMKLKSTDKKRNEQLWERTGQVPIQTEIGRRRWKWVGHTLRKGKNSITRQALHWNPQGLRGRGRPRETWRRCMEREMKDVGMTWVALSKKAQDQGCVEDVCLWPIP